MQLSVTARITVFVIALLMILHHGDNQTLATEVTVDQLNEAQTFIQRELKKLDQAKDAPQIEVQRRQLQSKLICVQGTIKQNFDLQNQAICKQVVQEIADGKFQRSAQEKAQDWMPLIIVGIVVAIFILSKIRM
ncbi:MAG: hypothetical protein HC865_25675 [Cyanobacteria bacterium RU_5_0]|nr:hypothetical protein [Cyanobacteria bacterium RU_5_0]